MDYEDTKIDIIGDFWCLVLAGVSLYALVSLIIKYIMNESNNSELFWTIIINFPFILIFIGIPYVNIKNSKQNRNIAKTIKEKGVKVTGTIQSIKSTFKPDYKNSLFKRASFFSEKKQRLGGGTGEFDNYYDYAIVEYKYKSDTKIVNTPYLNFYKDDLISKDVDVFIYEDMVYVDNFKIKREEIKKSKRNWNNMQIKVVFAFMLAIILIIISIYLTIVGVIPKGYIAYIISGLMIMYLVSGSIIYLRYLNEVFNRKGFNNSDKFDEKE